MPVATIELSPRQASFLASVIGERVVPTDVQENIPALLGDRPFIEVINYIKTFPRQGATVATPAAVVAQPTTPTLPDGFYTVVDGDGKHLTFRVKTTTFRDGSVKKVIGYLFGSNNEYSYKNFGFVTSRGVSPWRSVNVGPRITGAAQYLLTGDLDEARQQFINIAEAFAIESGHCLRCVRLLTVPESVVRGFGPDCAAQLGLTR